MAEHKLDVGVVGEEAVVDGVDGTWRVDPALLGQAFTGRGAPLSPFDRLLHDRKRSPQSTGEIDDLASWLHLEPLRKG